MANVFVDNRDHDALARLIRRERPDIVGLVEVNGGWVADLAEVRGEFPYRVEAFDPSFPRGGWPSGFASRRSTSMVPRSRRATAGRFCMRSSGSAAILDTSGWSIRRPHSGGWDSHVRQSRTGWPGKDDRLQSWISDRRRRHEHARTARPSSPTSSARRACGTAGSASGGSRAGRSVRPTGSRSTTRLLSDDLAVVDRRLGPSIGSDHFPLILDLAPPQRARRRTRSTQRLPVGGLGEGWRDAPVVELGAVGLAQEATSRSAARSGRAARPAPRRRRSPRWSWRAQAAPNAGRRGAGRGGPGGHLVASRPDGPAVRRQRRPTASGDRGRRVAGIQTATRSGRARADDGDARSGRVQAGTDPAAARGRGWGGGGTRTALAGRLIDRTLGRVAGRWKSRIRGAIGSSAVVSS